MTPIGQADLEAGLDTIRQAPRDEGRLELIVRRPGVGTREVVAEADLDLQVGLVGDSWRRRASSRTGFRAPHADMQINVMNARAIALIAGDRANWALAGDQLYVDLDLSADNLPPGTRLAIGDEAVIQVTAQPHTGCGKFTKRFGEAATRFVNSPVGRSLNLRGINARVVVPGRICTGDRVRKLP
jgi:hypothetical protein